MPESFREKGLRFPLIPEAASGGAGRSKGAACGEWSRRLPGSERRPGHQQRSASRKGSSDKVSKNVHAVYKRRDAWGVFGIGETLEEAVGIAKSGKGDFRRSIKGAGVHGGVRRIPRKNGADRTTGMQSFLQTSARPRRDESTFRVQTTRKSHAEFFEPAIVAADEKRRVRGTR